MINNYLNHSLQEIDKCDNFIDFFCLKCQNKFYFYIKYNKWMKFPVIGFQFELKLTCEEQIIKNLLE